MSIELQRPSIDMLPSYIEGLHDIARNSSAKKQSVAKEVAEIKKNQSAFVAKLIGANTNEIRYFVVAEDNVVGLFTFRPRLDEELELFGGNVGYGINPSNQNKGFATAGLKHLKKIAKDEYDLDRLLVTCEPQNKASIRVVEKCDGVYQDTVTDARNRTVKCYWIELN